MQIIELPNHVFFIGAQFHPEFKSRPGKPSPLFLGKATLFLIQHFFIEINLEHLHFLNTNASNDHRVNCGSVRTARPAAQAQLRHRQFETGTQIQHQRHRHRNADHKTLPERAREEEAAHQLGERMLREWQRHPHLTKQPQPQPQHRPTFCFCCFGRTLSSFFFSGISDLELLK